MFDSLRDKFQTVQEGITASFRGLSVGESPQRLQVSSSAVNYNAGADVLHKYQSQWSELHKLTEENAVKAQEVDNAIGCLHQKFEKQWSDVSHMASTLAAVPQLLTSVQQLMEQIVSLASEHADKVVQHELRQQKLLRERQDAFGQAFQQDVQEFKLSGSLPKMENIGVARGPALEEVTLEPADPEELDKFLNDDSSEQKSRRDSCLNMENPMN
ncbi:dysbindin isoform X2 [Cryptotermes secundus]|uniref:dysbindin isoform X2 n=1 Tax=Cryptotermes secundus TaxID=105785 RepID=UPI001454D5A9|nr:dysbindin isoform X2 [Cryptotermes secundus]